MVRLRRIITRVGGGLGAAACALLFASASGIAAPAAGAAQAGFTAPAYVALQGSDAVEILPAARLCRDLPAAHYVAASHDGAMLLVSSATRPEAYLVDAHTCAKLATFAVGATAQGVAISPDGRTGLAVSAGDGTVVLIDLKARRVEKVIAVGKTPHNARFTADGRKAYVTLQGEGAVAVVDVAARTKAGSFLTPGLPQPHNLDLSADGRTLWLRGLVAKVAAVDLATHKVLAVVPVGLGHGGIDVAPDGQVFAGAVGDHRVDVIDPQTYRVVRRIDVGQGPHGVRASRDGRFVYAGVTGTGRVAVIDARTLDVVRQVPVDGTIPFWIAVAGND